MALDILKIIKYEGGPDQLVWKHPAEDFNTGQGPCLCKPG